jgi:hypothetical protein
MLGGGGGGGEIIELFNAKFSPIYVFLFLQNK